MDYDFAQDEASFGADWWPSVPTRPTEFIAPALAINWKLIFLGGMGLLVGGFVVYKLVTAALASPALVSALGVGGAKVKAAASLPLL